MKYRKLRIAFSVTCGIACVLLVVLWVRSYWWTDCIVWTRGTDSSYLASYRGHFGFAESSDPFAPTGNVDWGVTSEWIGGESDFYKLDDAIIMNGPFVLPNYMTFWLPVLITAPFAAMPWIRWRFSLRTLLIATTIVALALGLIIATIR